MADRSRKPRGQSSGRAGSGRVTPRPGAKPTSAERAAAKSRPGIDERAMVGRRPSNPAWLLVLGVAWIACGFGAVFGLTAGWRFVPGVFFLGVGLFFIRGSAASLLRRGRSGADS
jgi:hypothetical protein